MIEYFLIFCVGISFGSFANVLIFRIPQNISIILPSSFCPTCKRALKWYEKLPILSFLFLGGKCKSCGAKIPKYYIFNEIFGGILALIFMDSLAGIFCFLFLLNFYVLSVIDYKFLRIPDVLNFLGFFLALICGILKFEILEVLFNAFLFLGFATFLRLFVGSIAKKEVLGEGDLIIFGAMGAIFSIENTMISIFLSSFFALIFLGFYYLKYHKNAAIPFVPFLFLGSLFVLIFEDFLRSYLL